MIHYLLTQLAANQVTLLAYAVVIVFALAVAWIMTAVETIRLILENINKIAEGNVFLVETNHQSKPPKRKAKHARKR